ncbi:hypothetical protein [Streptomyces sp. NPDC101206]|uniref:hypothetical protein n=1 Tax=Streptomyces sp. NPDC101206 TaxID=3366128 RepID=UPI0038226BDB
MLAAPRFLRTMSAVALRVGRLTVVDNRTAVHGRASFTPRSGVRVASKPMNLPCGQ